MLVLALVLIRGTKIQSVDEYYLTHMEDIQEDSETVTIDRNGLGIFLNILHMRQIVFVHGLNFGSSYQNQCQYQHDSDHYNIFFHAIILSLPLVIIIVVKLRILCRRFFLFALF